MYHQAVDNHEKRSNLFLVEMGQVCAPGNQTLKTMQMVYREKKIKIKKIQHLSELFQLPELFL